MVTPSCSTAVSALVMYEISPRNMLVPILYKIAQPMLSRKSTGTRKDSVESSRTRNARHVAMTT